MGEWTGKKWREEKWREAEGLLSALCTEISNGKFQILLPHEMPHRGDVNPLHMPFALVFEHKKDIRRFTERKSKVLNEIKRKMNEWAKKEINPSAVIEIEIPLANEIKKKYVD